MLKIQIRFCLVDCSATNPEKVYVKQTGVKVPLFESDLDPGRGALQRVLCLLTAGSILIKKIRDDFYSVFFFSSSVWIKVLFLMWDTSHIEPDISHLAAIFPHSCKSMHHVYGWCQLVDQYWSHVQQRKVIETINRITACCDFCLQ